MTINKKSTNLIETWVNSAKNHVPGYKVRDALAEVNAALGKKYDMNVIGKWRRGDKPMPQPVQDYMLRDVIYDVLRAEGLVALTDDSQLDRIAAMITPPNRL